VDWTTLVATIGTLIAAVGGATGVLILLSGWLGRVWATRIAQQERAKLEADLERTRHDFDVKLEQLRAEIRSGERRDGSKPASASGSGRSVEGRRRDEAGKHGCPDVGHARPRTGHCASA
jgi:hypothetical protein